MTNFGKARWSTNGDTLRMGMDFSKVDKKGRMVYGWATLDNVDTENDVITKEASADAFARSRGNLREMHKKDSAVGRVVSFKEDTFRAPDGQIYNGIFVKVRVSEGAPDTWAKVLDGTLNGFSIGGNIVEATDEFTKDSGVKIRKITKFDLNELSLVDNPGNQYSDFTNVFKIRKSADGSVTTLTGMVEDSHLLNVFYCSDDEIIKETAGEAQDCPVCERGMNRIGFVEDIGDRDGKVNALVTKFIGGGGETMAKINKAKGDESVETGHEAGDPTEVPTPAQPAEEPVEVEEVPDEEDELKKKIDNLHADIKDILTKSKSENQEQIEELKKTIATVKEQFDTKTSEISQELTKVLQVQESLDESLRTTKSKMTAMENSLEKMNSGGAFKKSVDGSTTPTAPEQKNDIWEGSALSLSGALHHS